MDPSAVSTAGPLLIGDQALTPRVSIGRGGAIVVDNTTSPAAVAMTQLASAGALAAPSITTGAVACAACTTGALTTTSLSTGPITCSALTSATGVTSSQCSVRVQLNSGQSAFNNVDTVVVFDTLQSTATGDGPVNWPGLVLPTGVFTAPRAGLYLITTRASYTTSTVGIRDTWVIIRGSSRRWGEDCANAPAAATVMTHGGSFVHRLGAGSTVSLHALQNSGGTLVLGGGGSVFITYLHIDYLSE